MFPWQVVAGFAGGLILIYLITWLLSGPLKMLRHFILGGLGGLALLLVASYIGELAGYTIGLNWTSVLVSFVLGLPGAIAVIVMSLVF